MADPESSQGPRRSQRDKKTVKAFASDSAAAKRKRNDTDTEGDFNDLTDIDDILSAGEDADKEEEYTAPKPKAKASPSVKTVKPKAKTPSPTKKPRVTKTPAPKAPKATTRRAKKGKGDGDAFDAAKAALDTKINADNPLFNAILNPFAALQSTAEDFLESLGQNAGTAQAELINCVLRACGCNDSVDGDEVLDHDGVLDMLDNITESLKQDNSPVYPLTSKLPTFKKFRKSLSEFIERLILSAAELGSLYSTDLMSTLSTWIIAMSSSHIRSFRHTATVIALEVETALCDVAASVEKEAEVVMRQKEGEKKRKASNKAAGAKEKELEGKAKEIRQRRTHLAEYLNEFVNAVFIHRYRDLDSHIRAECVKALGLWFKKYPGHFLDSSYLRYVGWVLSDAATQVRLEAVKALSGVYEQVDYIGSLNLFTERFKPRLIEIACGDVDLGVRVAVIQVLGAIDGHSLLEDEEREKLCLLLFDEQAKVRKAVSGFVRGVWEDVVEERLLGKKAGEKAKEYAGMKALAILLVKWAKALDRVSGDDEEESDDQREGGPGGGKRKARAFAAVLASGQKGRTALAVEALWDAVDAVRDWEGILQILLLDHSAAGEDDGERQGRRKANGTATKDSSVLDEVWRLEEVEESALLEVLVASLRRAKADASVPTKKGGEETVVSDITRALIKGLPRLFIKYQTDQNRIADVLLIPPLMNLDLYLEMRMITAYAHLWDDVTKQFLSHSSMLVLNHAVACIRYFMETTSLSNTNSTKILELEDELSSSLRDTVAGRDEIEFAAFTEDEVLGLGVICSRLAVLAGSRDMTNWIEENEGGKQSSAWDIISALVERGRLGYKEEEHMIDQALNLLNLHIIWKARGLTASSEPAAEEIRYSELLREQRDSLVEKLIEYAVGTQSNTADGVKRSAFQILLNLHVLFCPTQAVAADGSSLPTASLAMIMGDEVQYRCAGYIQAETERHLEEIEGDAPRPDGGEGQGKTSDEDSDRDDVEGEKTPQQAKKGKAGKGAKQAAGNVNVDDKATTRTRLEQEYAFMGVIATFLRAVRAGAVHVRHGAVLLAHYGRLGPAFDGCTKVIVDILREEGVQNHTGEVVVVVVAHAIKESFTLVLDRIVPDESHTVALAKTLSSSFVVRGPQLSIVQRLGSQFAVQIHTQLLTWIAKKLTVYENNKNKKGRNTAALFFRVLMPLTTAIDARDALKIKAHMDQVLAQTKIERSATSRIWEPQRTYEKKLGVAMKDKAAGAKGRKAKGAKGVAAISSDEESEVERLMGDGETVARPRPKPARRSARNAISDGTLTDLEDLGQSAPEDEPPKSRPQPRPTYQSPSRDQPGKELPVQSPISQGASISSPDMNGVATPIVARKRGRSISAEAPANDPAPADEDHSNDQPIASPTATDLQIRRKRVRH